VDRQDAALEGYGYEITGADVWATYANTIKAAEKAGAWDGGARSDQGARRERDKRRALCHSGTRSGPGPLNIGSRIRYRVEIADSQSEIVVGRRLWSWRVLSLVTTLRKLSENILRNTPRRPYTDGPIYRDFLVMYVWHQPPSSPHKPYLKALRFARVLSIAGEPRELLAGAAAGPWMRGPGLMRGIGHSWIWGSNTVSSPASSIRFVGAISSPSGGGMMVMAGDVAIKGRASGRPWVIRAYPP
jgi:hypothetical protein